MKFYKTILILLFIILLSPKSYAMKYKYLCRGDDSRIILQFDGNKKSAKNRVSKTKLEFSDFHSIIWMIIKNFVKFHYRLIKIALDIYISFLPTLAYIGAFSKGWFRIIAYISWCTADVTLKICNNVWNRILLKVTKFHICI